VRGKDYVLHARQQRRPDDHDTHRGTTQIHLVHDPRGNESAQTQRLGDLEILKKKHAAPPIPPSTRLGGLLIPGYHPLDEGGVLAEYIIPLFTYRDYV
jgi:hypothetical protein